MLPVDATQHQPRNGDDARAPGVPRVGDEGA